MSERPEANAAGPLLPQAPRAPRAEIALIGLLLAAAACAAAFIAVYALSPIPHTTQYLGLSLGLAFVALAAALTVVARRLVDTEQLEGSYPPDEHEPEVGEVTELVEESSGRLTRRRLVVATATLSGATVGAALLAPVLSLGPAFDLDSFVETPWRKGRRLVGEDGHPLRADEIEEEDFYTAYPEGADREDMASPLVVVRLPVSELRLPAGRKGWAPEGILAYSKICTHAGCAVSLYRTPTFAPTAPPPALVCPCHYSTFDPARGAAVTFGPAGRPLPQLPLELGQGGELRAAGNLSGPRRARVVGCPLEEADMIRAAVEALDRSTAGAPLLKKGLRYLFPDNWSFLLGEVALYAFMVLVATGVYLVLFFHASTLPVAYHGPYEPLDGVQMSEAYRSVVVLSLSTRAGLLIRQTHHWAADVFIVAIILHLFRVFFTGAFRSPRRLTYYLGVTMLVLALIEGYAGYSLVDDLLSGMGLAIGYAVLLSVPFIGANLAALVWGGPFPNEATFWPRLYIIHVLILPVLIGTILAVHLALVAARHHTQFRESERHTERRVIGVPAFPGQAPRSLALMFAVAGVLFLLGGLVQINPIWLWGPYHVGASTNGAQPDWYLGWLIGALRLVPGWDLVIDNRTVVPNPFWGGVLFPGIVFGLLYLWPTLERRLTRDLATHNLAERPRDNPWRTAIGAALISWVFLIFLAGSADRVNVLFGLDYTRQIEVYRVAIWVIPVVVLMVTRRVCIELVAGEAVARIRQEAAAQPPRRTGIGT